MLVVHRCSDLPNTVSAITLRLGVLPPSPPAEKATTRSDQAVDFGQRNYGT